MDKFAAFSVKDLLRSVVLGVLVGWLLISIHDPEHKRFEFKVTLAAPFGQLIG